MVTRALLALISSLLVMGLLACSGEPSADGKAEPTLPTPALAAAKGQHVWLSAFGGTGVRSADGGATWRVWSSGIPDIFPAVAFADAHHGWTTGTTPDGDAAVAVTNDGGLSWSVFTPWPDRALMLTDIACHGQSHAWVVGRHAGDETFIGSTEDGGATWQMKRLTRPLHDPNLVFVDKRFGWLVGSEDEAYRSCIYATTDGGETWLLQLRSERGVGLYDLDFGDPVNGWAVGGTDDRRGGTGVLFTTHDGGRTWQQSRPLPRLPVLRSVSAPSERRVTIVGEKGVVVASSDGGSTWERQSVGAEPVLDNVVFADDETGWILSRPHLLFATTDGGRVWHTVRLGKDAACVDIAAFAGLR